VTHTPLLTRGLLIPTRLGGALRLANQYARIGRTFSEGVVTTGAEFGERLVQAIECYSCSKRLEADDAYCAYCGNPLLAIERQSHRLESAQEVEEVLLDRLQARDYLILETENSVYRLTMLEPARRFGLLSGGILGGSGVKAMLVATIPIDHPELVSQIATVRTQSRAIFALESAKYTERLVTSVITKLTQVQGGQITASIPER